MAVDNMGQDIRRNIFGKKLLPIQNLDNFLSTVYSPLSYVLMSCYVHSCRTEAGEITILFQDHLAARALNVTWMI
jgi:hypothetical protein